MANDDEYKGYRIECRPPTSGVSAPAAPPYSPVTFRVYNKSDGRLIHTGEVPGSFNSPQEAFTVGHQAARKWIDAAEKKRGK